MIEVKNLKRVYQSEGGQEVVALNDIDLTLQRGRFVALKGRSGSGKTTLLNCLGGLDRPTAGQILIEGKPIEKLDDTEQTNWRKKEVGFIFQSFGLISSLSAYENIELMLRIARFPRAERKARTLEVLDLVGLTEWANHRPYEMSGGQQQRVAIARAIANRPKLMLADEATGELDTDTTHDILNLLRRIVDEEGLTILLATHDPLVDPYVDELFHLSDGQIMTHSRPNGSNELAQTEWAEQAGGKEPPEAKRPATGADVKTDKPLAASSEVETIDQANTAPTEGNTPEKVEGETRRLPISLEDHIWAILLGLFGLLLYGRTLAPGLLYGDSAEFQTLAQTFGLAHVSGYSTYILISHLFTYLPIGTLAWRINLLSALGGIGTIVGLYYLIRHLISDRITPLLVGFALYVSNTLWSQSIIAEVYTLGTLWWVLMTLLLWRWGERDVDAPFYLFGVGLLLPLGYGIHLYTLLIGPAAAIFALMVLRRRGSGWGKGVAYGLAGTVLGCLLLILSIYIVDQNGPETGVLATSLSPYYTAWSLSPADFERFGGRLWLLFSNPQWGGTLFENGLTGALTQTGLILGRMLFLEFSLLFLAAAVFGFIHLYRKERFKPIYWYLLIAFGINFFLAINYRPGDWHLFFLPTYLVLGITAAVGLSKWLNSLSARPAWAPWSVILLFVLLLGQHFWPSRLNALLAGSGTFVTDTYPYPIENLGEPRERAEALLQDLPDDAVLILEWRVMYAAMYIAHVERGLTDTRFVELFPYGSGRSDIPALMETLNRYHAAGRPIYTEGPLPGTPGFQPEPDGARFRLVPNEE